MRVHRFPRAGLLCAAALLAGCGAVPYRTSANAPLCLPGPVGCESDAVAVERARMTFSTQSELPKAFVGVALSGGGSRAANFDAAVLQNLDEMGLLRYVTAISSVSGGGLTGAYYALHAPNVDWPSARRLLASDFLGRWIAKNLYPQNIVSVAVTHEDRSDLMADVFDDVLFHGAKFGDLGPGGPGRPRWLANATNVGTGSRFPFVEENFHGYLRSRLDTFPISEAVMASAAFPGVFNDVTLKRFLSGRARYTHLMDGGPTDNLGVESLLQAATEYQQSLSEKTPNGQAAPCFMFIVDAYPEPDHDPKDADADVRGVVDHLVDTNFMDAFDILLSRRRLDMLQRIGLGPGAAQNGRQAPQSYSEAQMIDNGMPYFLPHLRVTTFDYPLDHSGYVWRGMIPGDSEAIKPSSVDRGQAPAENYFRCMVWHINLSASSRITQYEGTPGAAPRVVHGPEAAYTPLHRQRDRLDFLVAHIDTNFHLTGPKGCKAERIQSALYAAAGVLTRQDYEATESVCQWFDAAGMPTDARCRYFPGSELSIPDSEIDECLANTPYAGHER